MNDWIKRYGHLSGILAYFTILDTFTMASHWSFSNHITLVANFEKLQISLVFTSNSKNINCSEITLSCLQILKILNIISSHTKFLEKSPNLSEVVNKNLWNFELSERSLEYMIIVLPGETDQHWLAKHHCSLHY